MEIESKPKVTFSSNNDLSNLRRSMPKGVGLSNYCLFRIVPLNGTAFFLIVLVYLANIKISYLFYMTIISQRQAFVQLNLFLFQTRQI